MANRNFHNSNYSLTPDVVELFGAFDVGSAGAVANAVGNGLAFAKVATGRYSVTLADKYNRFLGGNFQVACDIDGTAITALTGKADVQTVTFPAKAAATAGDHIVLTTPAGVTWAISLDVAGTDPEPTAASWTAVAAARKVHVDISGTSTAASVAAAVEVAFDALTGASAAFVTDDSAANGTMLFTTAVRGPVAAVVLPGNTDGSTAGSISSVHTTTGVASSVDVTANTIALPSHGWTTGKAFALTIDSGTLPAGTSATTYYAIVVDANSIKLASSLANAEAGTTVDITDQGTADKIMSLTPVISGSGIFKVEMSATGVQAAVQAGTAVEFALYNASGALTQPANGSKVFVSMQLRNSSVKMLGE
jgi:hypothetical protein